MIALAYICKSTFIYADIFFDLQLVPFYLHHLKYLQHFNLVLLPAVNLQNEERAMLPTLKGHLLVINTILFLSGLLHKTATMGYRGRNDFRFSMTNQSLFSCLRSRGANHICSLSSAV